MQRQANHRVIFLRPNDTDTVGITSDVASPGGGDYANAAALVQDILDVNSEQPEFRVLSRTRVRLGETEAEEAVYSYRYLRAGDPHLPPGTVIDKMVVGRLIAADRKERIYDVSLLAEVDEYEGIKDGFEHLISTFRFLD
jgi:hypothetical protein